MITTIHTQKSVYKNNETYIGEKQKLFNNLSIKMIINELEKNNINITQKEIIDTYKSNYDINQTIDFFDRKYTDELDILSQKNEVFDDDALVYLIMKIVEHHFDIHNIPDVVYIANDINVLLHSENEYRILIQKIKNILKRLVRLSQYQKDKDIQNIFASYGIDLEQFFTRVFQDIQGINNVSLLKEIDDLLNQMEDCFHLSLRYAEIKIDVLGAIVFYDQKDIDKRIRALINKYPDYRFMIYYKILNSLYSANKKELVQYYLKEVLKFQPENEEQADLVDVIKEIFS